MGKAIPSRWTPAYAGEVLRHLDERLSLVAPGGEARLVSFGQNAVFHLADRGLSVRVYGPEHPAEKSRLMLDVARHLKAEGVPAVRPADDLGPQPHLVDDAVVTLWHWIEQSHAGPPRYRDFGRVLRRFHDVMERWSRPVPRFDPLGKIEERMARIAAVQLLTGSEQAVLRNSLERLSALVHTTVRDDGRWVTLHGDATPANALAVDAELTLIDFDSVCRGPREWDLISAVATTADDRTTAWRELLGGYAVDEAALMGHEGLTALKQFSISVVQCLGAERSPEARERAVAHVRWWHGWCSGDPPMEFARLFARRRNA